VFELTEDEIARINPNTKTGPVFRSRSDAELTAKLYSRAPVMIEERSQEEGGNINPWGIAFQTMFHMSSDSGFFRTPAQLEAEGWRCEGVDWARKTVAGVERRVPLYEAKMIHHFDHRWATYGAGTSDDEESARDCAVAEKQNPDFEPSPRYWVPEEEVTLRAARVIDMILPPMRGLYAVCNQNENEQGLYRGGVITDMAVCLAQEPPVEGNIVRIDVFTKGCALAYATLGGADGVCRPDAHTRLTSGGWARQVTVREFGISKDIAGVDMRLNAGSVRELHWHKEAATGTLRPTPTKLGYRPLA
jgi:hypothetical protein